MKFYAEKNPEKAEILIKAIASDGALSNIFFSSSVNKSSILFMFLAFEEKLCENEYIKNLQVSINLFLLPHNLPLRLWSSTSVLTFCAENRTSCRNLMTNFLKRGEYFKRKLPS